MSVRLSSGILVLSRTVEHQLVTRFPSLNKPVFLFEHGPLFLEKTAAARIFPQGRPLTIGFVGRIVEYKGLQTFVRAIIELHQSGIPISGVIAGEGEIGPDIRKLISSTEEIFSIRNHWLTDNEIQQQLRAIDLLVLPYIEASQSGIVAAAQAVRLPVIVTPLGGLVDQVEDNVNGIVAEGTGVSSIVTAITKLMTKPELYEFISQKQIQKSKTSSSWSQMARFIISVAR